VFCASASEEKVSAAASTFTETLKRLSIFKAPANTINWNFQFRPLIRIRYAFCAFDTTNLPPGKALKRVGQVSINGLDGKWNYLLSKIMNASF
jgi:hypothetical protein